MRSRLGLSWRLAGFLQTDIRATDDGWRVMIPEMLQTLFQKVILHRQLANFALQFGHPPGIIKRRYLSAAPSSAGE